MEASNTHEMTKDGPLHAWLVLAVGDDRQHGGNEGYDAGPAVHYSWDSTVPNHEAVAGGERSSSGTNGASWGLGDRED